MQKQIGQNACERPCECIARGMWASTWLESAKPEMYRMHGDSIQNRCKCALWLRPDAIQMSN